MRPRVGVAPAVLGHIAHQRQLTRKLTAWTRYQLSAPVETWECPEVSAGVRATPNRSRAAHSGSSVLQFCFTNGFLRNQMHTRSQTIRVSHLAGETLDSCQRRFLQFESFKAYAPCAPKEAAVLVPLFEDDEGTVRVVLTQRSRLLKKHAGEVAFPGGKRDPEDLTIEDTALREAEEEMSLEPSQVKVIATLSPVLSLHHLSVTPVIGLIPANAVEDLQPCPTEVDSIFTVPLYFFLEEHGRHTYQDAHMGNFSYRIHHFRHNLYDIWGLTAGMLIRVAEIAYGRPADFDVHGSATDYSTLYYDGNQICSRGCSGTDDVCFLEDGKPEIRARQ